MTSWVTFRFQHILILSLKQDCQELFYSSGHCTSKSQTVKNFSTPPVIALPNLRAFLLLSFAHRNFFLVPFTTSFFKKISSKQLFQFVPSFGCHGYYHATQKQKAFCCCYPYSRWYQSFTSRNSKLFCCYLGNFFTWLYSNLRACRFWHSWLLLRRCCLYCP
jgi:hypothetical protein